ncbi:MAG: hypothetical protein WCI91_04015 [Candidatus Nomurabacteria bacterium]
MVIDIIKNKKDISGSGTVPEQQEKVRGRLAIGLLLLFAIVLLLSVMYTLFGSITPEKSDLIKYLLSGLIGMMGVIIGFYYGQNTK